MLLSVTVNVSIFRPEVPANKLSSLISPCLFLANALAPRMPGVWLCAECVLLDILPHKIAENLRTWSVLQAAQPYETLPEIRFNANTESGFLFSHVDSVPSGYTKGIPYGWPFLFERSRAPPNGEPRCRGRYRTARPEG